MANRPKNKFCTNFIDWICVLMIRYYEKDGRNRIVDEKIQSRISDDERRDGFKLKEPVYSMAQRAEDLLPEYCHCSKKDVPSFLKRFWKWAIIFVSVIGVSFVAGGYMTKILPSTGTADLFYFIYFFFVFHFLLLVSSIFFSAWSLLFPRKQEESDNPPDLAGIVGTLAIRFVRWLLSREWFGTYGKGIANISHAFFSKPRFVLAVVACLTHLYWLIVAVAACISMNFIFEYNEYDFELLSTTVKHSDSTSKISRGLRVFGPLVACFGYDVPTTEDIRLIESDSDEYWAEYVEEQKRKTENKTNMGEDTIDDPYSLALLLFGPEVDEYWPRSPDGDDSVERDKTPPKEEILAVFQKERKKAVGKVAEFLSGLTLAWMVVPRLIMLLVSVGLYKIGRNDFYPDLSEAYYTGLIHDMESLEAPPSTDSTPPPPPPPATNGGFEKLLGVLTEVVTSRKRKPTPSPSSGAAQTNSLTVAGDCGTIVKPETWDAILGSETEKVIFADFTGKLNEIVAWAPAHSNRTGRLVLLFDIGSNPDYGKINAVERLFELFPGATAYVILSCGEQIRIKFGNNPKAISQLTGAWRSRLREIGVPQENIVEFDHRLYEETGASDSLRHLHGILAEAKQADQLADQLAGQLAGKFDEASQLILKSARIKSEDVESQAKRFANLRDSLNNLYAEQFGVFRAAAAQIEVPPELADRASDAMQQMGGMYEKGKEKIEEGIQGLAYYLELVKDVTPNATLGGVSVVGLGLATGGIALATGPVVGAFLLGATGYVGLKSILPQLQSFFRKNADTGSVNAPLVDPSIYDLVLEGTTWALILEMQGMPEEKLSKNLAELLRSIRDKKLEDDHQRREALDQVADRLRELE